MMSLKVLGITGSIGMGKTTIARILNAQGIPVHSADDTAARLMEDPPIRQAIACLCPQAYPQGYLDKNLLRQWAYSASENLDQLEMILHPAIQADRIKFLKTFEKQDMPFIAFEIPLLFEKGYEKMCHYVCVAYCPEALQKKRLLPSKGLTRDQGVFILKRQMPIEEKLERCDFVLSTNIDLQILEKNVVHLAAIIQEDIK